MAPKRESSPCAACKFLRRKCAPDCIYAPHFPPDQPNKFLKVHQVYGASNVHKILSDLPPEHREDAVNSLCYEAESRLRDPVYGCMALVSVLQQRVQNLHGALQNAHKELATYQGLVLQDQQAMGPNFAANQMTPVMMNHPMMQPSASMMGIPTGGIPLIREPGPQGNNPNIAFNPEPSMMGNPAGGIHLIREAGPQGNNPNHAFNPEPFPAGIPLIREPGPQGNNPNIAFNPEPSMMGIPIGGIPFIREAGPQGNNPNNAFHPEPSMMGIPTGGIPFIREPGPQGNNPNNAFNPEQFTAVPAAVVADPQQLQQQQLMIRASGSQNRNQNIWFDGGQGFDAEVGSSSGIGAHGTLINEPPPPLPMSPPNMPGGLESGLTHLHIMHQQGMQPQQMVAFEAHQVPEQESQGGNGYGEAGTGPGAKLMISALELQNRDQNIWFDGVQGFDAGVGSSSGIGAHGIIINEPPPPLPMSPPNMPGGLQSGLTHLHIPHQPGMQPQQMVAFEESQVPEQESQGENSYGEAGTGPGPGAAFH